MLSVILQLFLEIQSLKMMALSQSSPEGGRSCSALIGFNSTLRTYLFPKKEHSSLCSRRLLLNRKEQNLTFWWGAYVTVFSTGYVTEQQSWNRNVGKIITQVSAWLSQLNEVLLTVRATEPSRSTTEYNRPRLFIITCNGPETGPGWVNVLMHLWWKVGKTGSLPRTHSWHTWSAGPRGPPGPPGYQTHYCQWCWTPPCLPNLQQSA